MMNDDPFDDLPELGAPARGPVYGPPAKADKPPSGYIGDSSGYKPIPGGPADPTRPGGELDPNKPGADPKTAAEERKAAGFARRAIGAFTNYKRANIGPRNAVGNAMHDIAPNVLNSLPNDIGNSDKRRLADQAILEFTSAALRQDSGATIPQPEIESQRPTWFPRPGDESPEVMANYEQARVREVEALIAAAGRSVENDPALQKEIANWRASLGGPAIADTDAPALPPEQGGPPPLDLSGEKMDRPPTAMYENAAAPISAADGGQKVDADPSKAGANARVNEMLRNGASDRDIMQYLKERGGTVPFLVGVKTDLKAIREWQKNNKGYSGSYVIDVERVQKPTTTGENIAASGPGAAAFAFGDDLLGGHLDNARGLITGNPEEESARLEALRAAHPYWSLAGDVGAGAAMYAGASAAARAAGLGAKFAAVAPRYAAPAAGSEVAAALPAFSGRAIAGDAAAGGYVSSGQGGTQIIDPAGTVRGAVLGVATGAATRGALNTTGAAISPDGGQLAPLYAAGVRPSVGQRMGAADNWAGRMVNRAEQAFGSVPLLGGVQRSARNASIDDMQRGAFNQALGDIGLRLPKGVKKGSKAHAFMQKAFDNAYDKARSGMSFRPDGEWSADLGAIAKEVDLLDAGSSGIFRKIVFDIGSKLKASGGELNGDTYKTVVSRIDKKIGALLSNPNGDTELASSLMSLRTAIDGAARRRAGPAAAKLLDQADAGYAKAVIIENAGRARGGHGGEFNGNQLDAAVQRTDKSRRSRAYLRGEANMQRYGEAAKLQGDELADSGTPERLMTVGGLGAAASLLSPMTLLPWAANTAANLPGVRQVLGELMAPRPQSIRGFTDATRRELENIARYGGALGVPATVSGER